jgi:hypothetical protein
MGTLPLAYYGQLDRGRDAIETVDERSHVRERAGFDYESKPEKRLLRDSASVGWAKMASRKPV